MRFIFLAVALLIAATAPASAATPAEAKAKFEQAKAKFLTSCFADLRAHLEAHKRDLYRSTYSDDQVRTLCSCIFGHTVRVSRAEAKDYLISKRLVGSLGERMWIADRDCRAKSNIWPKT